MDSIKYYLQITNLGEFKRTMQQSLTRLRLSVFYYSKNKINRNSGAALTTVTMKLYTVFKIRPRTKNDRESEMQR